MLYKVTNDKNKDIVILNATDIDNACRKTIQYILRKLSDEIVDFNSATFININFDYFEEYKTSNEIVVTFDPGDKERTYYYVTKNESDFIEIKEK